MLRLKAMLGISIALALGATAARADLFDYVQAPDDSYQWKILETTRVNETSGPTVVVARLVSQTWHGDEWIHELRIIKPDVIVHPEAAILTIAGGANDENGEPRGPSPAELMMLTVIADRTHSIAVVLSQVPNQPILGGRSEDAAIAHTFTQFLETGEEDWPLLFPMVKSAMRAMDAATEIAKEQWEIEIEKFLVSGGSKRGWTTWLTAVADPRVFCIAPVVIDNLNLAPQMAHQLESWGDYSASISDYTEANLIQRLGAAGGREARLREITDPYTYRSRLTLPKLICIGTNDPYWVLDAADLYFDDLVGPKYLYYSANTGHSISLDGLAAIAGFYVHYRKSNPMPTLSWTHQPGVRVHRLSVETDQPPREIRFWTAESTDRDFRNEQWSHTPVEPGVGGKIEVEVQIPEAGYRAFYLELRYPTDFGMPMGLCTLVKVVGVNPDKPAASSGQ